MTFWKMNELWILISIFCFLFYPCDGVAPVISGLPTSISVGELETTNRLVYTITVTDADLNDAVICDVRSTVPANGPFLVTKAVDTNKYGVNTNSPTFNFSATPVHTVNIECTDSASLTTVETLSVDIIAGDELTFTNIPASVSKDATVVTDGDTIFTVTSSDAFGHTTRTFTLTLTIPSTTSFDIDSGTGAVRATQDLTREIYTSINIYVTVSDGDMAVVEILTVLLTNVNNVPLFTNLPLSIDVLESIAAGTVLVTLTPSDADPGATLIYAMAVSPIAAAALFTYNTNTQQVSLATGKNFDFESAIYYNVTFTVSDTLATGGPFVLDVHIKNDDEPCYFDKTLYSLATSEGAAGSISLNPNFVVSDYDGISTYALSFTAVNNSQWLTIDSSTGVIGYAVDYDVDNGAMPSALVVTVQCRDPSGQTGTAYVEIQIADVNDNAPTFGQPSFILNVDQFTVAGALIGSLLPTDADSGVNTQFTCSGASASLVASLYYNIGPDCGVYLVSNPFGNLSYGTTISFTITATDKGATPLSGTTVVDVIFKETITTTSTTTVATTTDTSFFDDPASLAAFCVAVILGTILLGLFLYFLLRYCTTGACCGPEPCDFGRCCNQDHARHRPRRPRRTITPETPEKPRRRTKDEIEYWREDSDYGSMTKESRQIKGSRMSGPRDYPDFPRTAKAITPSDVGIGYGRSGPRITPLSYR